MKKILILLHLNLFLIASQFQLSDINNSLHFVMGELSIEEVGEYTRIKDHNVGTLLNDGMPEIPVYSTFYQVKNGVDYNFSFIINELRKIMRSNNPNPADIEIIRNPTYIFFLFLFFIYFLFLWR